jgi:tetratricopeptide (TPR) repeat protein
LGGDSDLEVPDRQTDGGPSVRHLYELGYVDPVETAVQETARREKLETQLRWAIELNREGRGREAATLLTTLAEEDGDWVAPHQLLAEHHYSAGNWQAAELELAWLAQHGVDQPRTAQIAAGILMMRRDFLAALNELEFARCVDPNLPSINTMCGTAYLRLRRWDQAEDAFREAAQQDPSDARARDGMAAVYLRRGECEDAADWAFRALEQDMRLFHAHYHLGLALAGMDRPNDAISALETAARLNDRRAAPYYWLSRIVDEQLDDRLRSAQYRQRAKEVIRTRRAGHRAAATSE